MAAIQRIIFLFLFFFSVSAAADSYPARPFYAVAYGSPPISYWTMEQACDEFIRRHATERGLMPATVTVCQIDPDNSSNILTRYRSNDGGIHGQFLGATRHFACQNGGTLQGNMCVDAPACTPPQVRDPVTGACGAPPETCQAGRVLLAGPFADTDGDGQIPSSSCINKCRATHQGGGQPQISCSLGGAGSIGLCGYVYPGDYVDTGASCNDADTSPPKDPPANKPPCPACDCMEKGGSFGQVQGVDTCLPKGTPGTLPVQTKPPPKVTETTPPATPENPDPQPERTVEPQPTVTVIPNPAGGEPTVKEETTNPDGSTTTTTSTMGQYCKDNATSSTCKSTGEGAGGSGGGDFRGNCDIGFTCSGDGVQCAIARKIHEQRCEDLKGMEPFSTVADAGGKVLRGETPQDVTDFLDREGSATKNINVGNLVKETGDFNFAAGCIADVSFSIGGHSITVPLSDVCPYFEMIGYFLLAAAYLAALRIVEII